MSDRYQILAYLYDHGTASLQEIADAVSLRVSTVAAYLGAFHEYGYITKYGNEPESLVRWDSQYVEPLVWGWIKIGREELADATAGDAG